MLRNFITAKQIAELIPSIRPDRLGGNGRSNMLALLGENLMRMLAAESALKGGNTGDLDAYCQKIFSTKNMANCSTRALVPDVVKSEELAGLSDGEKKTMVEAYVGALYEAEKFQATKKLKLAAFDLLASADALAASGRLQPFNNISEKITKHNARIRLQHLLQNRGYEIKSDLYVFESKHEGGYKDHPPFVGIFALRDELVAYGLPALGEIKSGLCPSKRIAAEEVAQKVLSTLQGLPISQQVTEEFEQEDTKDWRSKKLKRKRKKRR